MAPDTTRRLYDILNWTVIVASVAYLARVVRIVSSRAY